MRYITTFVGEILPRITTLVGSIFTTFAGGWFVGIITFVGSIGPARERNGRAGQGDISKIHVWKLYFLAHKMPFLRVAYVVAKKKNSTKNEPCICHSEMLRWLPGIILGQIISEIPLIGNIYKEWRSLFWVKIGNFLDRKGWPNVHILFCLHKTSSFTFL